jgi:hypothetical protein
LDKPPIESVRDAVRIERGDDQVDKVNGQSEVGNELRSRDQ